MTNLQGMFADDKAIVRIAGNGNQMSYTAALTNVATTTARGMLTIFNEDPDKWQARVLESQESHDVMDELIAEIADLSKDDASFLEGEDEETIDKMIKSQQSKRSRAKSREMTMDNYLTMLTGAIAENLLRIVANKPKSAGGVARRINVIPTEEEMAMLANDPEALGRMIRNVQSKKSIEKRRDGFSEESERWQDLLIAEDMLKGLRDGHNIEAEQAIETNKQVEELLGTIETKELKAAEAKDMLESIKQMLASKKESVDNE